MQSAISGGDSMDTAEPVADPAQPSDAAEGGPATRNGPPVWLAVVVSVVAGFGPPPTALSAGLDSSWQLGLSWARMSGLHWGSDIVFTYGPWGALVAPIPLSAMLLWQGIFAWIVTLALVAWATCRLAARTSGWWSTLLAISVTAAAASSGLATALFLAVVLCLVVEVRRASDDPRMLLLLGAIAGFSVLIKFNTGCATLAIGTLAAFATSRRIVATSGFLAAASAGAVGGWLAAGQPIQFFTAWVRGSVEIAVAYSFAMRHVRVDLAAWLPIATHAFGVTAALSLGAIAWLSGAELARRRRVVLTLMFLVTAVALHLASATRLDAGHLSLLPCSLFVLGMPLAGSMVGGRRRPNGGHADDAAGSHLSIPAAVTAAVALTCVALSFALLGSAGLWQYLHPASSLEALRAQLRLAVNSTARAEDVDAQKAAIRERYSVPSWEVDALNPKASRVAGPSPAVVESLRGRRVHVEPWAIGAAWAHELAWKPVPVFQTYAAYTASLDELNAAELTDDDGPDGVLRQSVAIDGKHPLWESPRHQLTMLCSFAQASTDGRWQALTRVTHRCGAPRSFGTVVASPGESVAVPSVPGSIVIAEFSNRPGETKGIRKQAVVNCGSSAHPLSQGFPSGPLVMRAEASGWDPRTMPAPCENVGANRPVRIDFKAVPVRGGR